MTSRLVRHLTRRRLGRPPALDANGFPEWLEDEFRHVGNDLAALDDPAFRERFLIRVGGAEPPAGASVPPPGHDLRALLHRAPGTPPVKPAEFWDDAQVARKFDASRHDWTPPESAPVIVLVCACGWQSAAVAPPAGTRVTYPLRAEFAPVLLTSAAFIRECERTWRAHVTAPTA